MAHRTLLIQHLQAIGGYIGTIKAIDPSTAGNLTSLDIAYISCDPNIDVSNINPTEVILNAAMVQPKAIVLYSLTEANCNLTGYLYTTIYSMISTSDSASFLKTIQSATQLQANIDANSTVSNSSGSGITANNSDDGVQDRSKLPPRAFLASSRVSSPCCS